MKGDIVYRDGLNPGQKLAPRELSHQGKLLLRISVGVLVVVVIVGGSAFQGARKKHQADELAKASRLKDQTALVLAKQTASGDLPAYAILQSPLQNRHLVITEEKSRSKLVALNDALVRSFGINDRQPLFIDYFDDQSVGLSYFSKINQTGLSQASRDELYSHYTALMVGGKGFGQNTFYLQGRPPVVLKQY